MIKRMLVVDDEQEYLNLISDLFRNENILIEGTKTVLDTYRLVMNNEYDCVLLDLKLLDGCGLKLASRIKKYLPTNAKVILITANHEELKEECDELMNDKTVFGVHDKMASVVNLKRMVLND